MITSLLASFLTLLYLKITIEVISKRRSQKISLGNGDENEILKYTSAHSNFASYVPMQVILLYLIEQSNLISIYFLVIIAVLIFLGRLFHYKALTSQKMKFSLRVKGMMFTIFPLMAMSLILIGIQIYKFINDL